MENSHTAFQTLFQCAPFPKSKFPQGSQSSFQYQGKFPSSWEKSHEPFKVLFNTLQNFPPSFQSCSQHLESSRPCEEIPTGFSKFLSIPREADGIISSKFFSIPRNIPNESGTLDFQTSIQPLGKFPTTLKSFCNNSNHSQHLAT